MNKVQAVNLTTSDIDNLSDLVDSVGVENANNDLDSALNTKIRNYAYILYPDSVDFNKFCDLLNSISDSRRMFLISPLHDKDKTDDGKDKKPHYHVFCMHSKDTNTTVKQARNFGKLNGLVGLEVVHSKIKYARYLCHLDNKDKFKYNVEGVRSFACDYSKIIGNFSDRIDDMKVIIDFINENDILFYSDLVDYCRDNNDAWFRQIMGGATFQLEKYIRERRNKAIFLKQI